MQGQQKRVMSVTVMKHAQRGMELFDLVLVFIQKSGSSLVARSVRRTCFRYDVGLGSRNAHFVRVTLCPYIPGTVWWSDMPSSGLG